MSYHDTLPLYSRFVKGDDPLLDGDEETGYSLTDAGFHVAYDVALAMGWREPAFGDHRRTMGSLHDFLEDVAANIRAAQMEAPCAAGEKGQCERCATAMLLAHLNIGLARALGRSSIPV